MIFKKKESSELFIVQKMEAGCREVARLLMVARILLFSCPRFELVRRLSLSCYGHLLELSVIDITTTLIKKVHILWYMGREDNL